MKRMTQNAQLGGLAVMMATTAIAAVAAPGASAQQPVPKPEAAGASFLAPRAKSGDGPVAYEDSATRRRFVLDRSGAEPLLKFEDSPEVYALRATTAQRGDDFLRSDTGSLILRVTELGNVIAFFGDANGAPAETAGPGTPLDRPPLTQSLADKVKDAGRRLTQLAGHEVTVFGAGEFADAEPWAADALLVAVMGVERANGIAGKAAGKLNALRLTRGEAPSAVFSKGELVLTVNPAEGYAGRPSSEVIARALSAGRDGV